MPAGIHRIHVTAWGGSGGPGGYRSGLYAAPGGLGAKLDLDLSVSPGDPLTINVGGRGGAGNNQIAGDGGGSGASGRSGGTAGTVNNKSLDGTAGGGGGGATSIVDRTGGTVLIAGGGGGGGGGGGAGTSYWTFQARNVLVTNAAPGFGEVIVSWDPTPPRGIMRTQRFSGAQRFTIPDGVTELTVTGWGGAGGAGGGNAFGVVATRGGYGAAIRERVAVNPGAGCARALSAGSPPAAAPAGARRGRPPRRT